MGRELSVYRRSPWEESASRKLESEQPLSTYPSVALQRPAFIGEADISASASRRRKSGCVTPSLLETEANRNSQQQLSATPKLKHASLLKRGERQREAFEGVAKTRTRSVDSWRSTPIPQLAPQEMTLRRTTLWSCSGNKKLVRATRSTSSGFLRGRTKETREAHIGHQKSK